MTLACGLAAPAGAPADTARIVVNHEPSHRGPVLASIVITGIDGGARTLGPFRFPKAPHGLRRSPDGRHFAVSWGDARVADRGLSVVPSDGGTPFLLRARRPGGALYDVSLGNISWSFDSREVVLGHVRDYEGDAAGDVVRCSLARRRCAVVPGVKGFAATVPGAIVTSTTAHDLGWVANYDPNRWGGPEERPADGPTRRALLQRRTAKTVRSTSRRTRVLLDRRATVLNGADAADGIVGGPSGALVTVDRYRLGRIERRGKTFVRWGGITRRWVIVGRRGSTTTVEPRRLLVPRAHGTVAEDVDSGAMLIRAQRAYPVPRAAIASGGWLAVTGTTPFAADTGGLVLTTLTPKGRATFLQTGGRIASATQLLRSVIARPAIRGTAAIEIVGYEAPTNAAIVQLSWDEPDPPSDADPPKAIPGTAGIVPTEDAGLRRHATVRVPLDGRTAPTVVSGAKEQVAW